VEEEDDWLGGESKGAWEREASQNQEKMKVQDGSKWWAVPTGGLVTRRSLMALAGVD
jgi:hypothetical protein